ncbi:MAG: ATP-binding protein, partial [Candidatus Aenigmarchaeota archaeon]|nr:ATP-binding protein [Candidatus Aenigmarchaeota archaeon]
VQNDDGKFDEVTFPPSPGTKVIEPDHAMLAKFLGLDENGLKIGKLPSHDVDVNLNMTKLLQKHLAILAISGAGKSYLVSVLLEEILNRKKEDGQIATVIIDTHGEYLSFADDPDYSDKITVFPGKDIRIGLSELSTGQISRFLPRLSGVQVRELARFLRQMKTDKKHFGVKDLIEKIQEDSKVKAATKDVLVSVLYELMETGVFGATSYPSTKELTQQGKISIIDMSSFVSSKVKQMIVAHLSQNMFNDRRDAKIPPFLLILEEAHQFVPETAKVENAISRGIIQTIAREGRKFHASICLISQRPIQLSTTVLSQCNTQIILRVTNPYDLDHIGKSAEGITREVQNQISGLRVGSGLIIGEGVNYPVFVKIRKRNSKESRTGLPLEQAAIEFSEKIKQNKEDAKSFM